MGMKSVAAALGNSLMRPRAREALRVAEEEVSVARKLMENASNPDIRNESV